MRHKNLQGVEGALFEDKDFFSFFLFFSIHMRAEYLTSSDNTCLQNKL